MTQKEVTEIIYNTLPQANRIEHKINNGKNCFIFKGINDEYIACYLTEDLNSAHSDVLGTLEECYNWIDQNA